MKKLSKKEKKRIDEDARSLSFSYTFLYIATIIFYVSLNSFTFYVFDMKFSYNIFILPFIFFLIDVILKEVGYKSGVIATIIGTIMFVVMNFLLDLIFGENFTLDSYFGICFAFFISNFLNLLIYNYMLANFKTPLPLVIINLVFACLIYNLFYYLVTLNLSFTTTLWSSFLAVTGIEVLICAICGILINLVQRGVD